MRWTDENIARVRTLAAQDLSSKEIAKALGSTPDAVASIAKRNNISTMRRVRRLVPKDPTLDHAYAVRTKQQWTWPMIEARLGLPEPCTALLAYAKARGYPTRALLNPGPRTRKLSLRDSVLIPKHDPWAGLGLHF